MPLGVEGVLRGVFNRARRGLYAGKYIKSGNNVSEDGKNKTRRFWRPNAQYVNLYSEALGRRVRVRVTTAALRTIDKYGGLDNYLLGHSDAALDSDKGVLLKRQIEAALQQRRRQQPASDTSSFLPPLAAATAAGIASGVDGSSMA